MSKSNFKKMKNLLLTLLILISSSLLAQTSYKLDGETSKMTVEGTSTLHDWESDVEQIQGNASLTLNGNVLTEIKSLSITIPVKSIKSGKSGMDSNTYNALKESKNPNITFVLSSATISGTSVKAKGKLTIAGFTKETELTTTYKSTSNGIAFEGSSTFKMSEYKVDPPTAMMGTIKTGDSVTINFNVLFKN